MVCMMYESYGIRRTDMVLLCIYTLCYGGRDPYCTGGVRRRCYDRHIIASLQMIENEWLCVIQMCVCDTRGMLDVLSIVYDNENVRIQV